MLVRILPLLGLLALAGALAAVRAESPSEVYKQVDGSVVGLDVDGAPGPAAGGATALRTLGSGVLISNDGKIMTAAHLVQTATSIEAVFVSGERIPARVVSTQPPADVALVQLERMPRETRIARLGDSDALEVGETVLVVGAGLGTRHVLSVGHVTARRRPDSMLGGMGLAEVFQTDVSVHPGNTGAPLFNLRGEVVGIASGAIALPGAGPGAGFAVTSNIARRVLLERPSFWTGLDGFLLRGELARVFNLPRPAGVLVERMSPASPAARLGLRAGTLEAHIGDQTLVLGGDVLLEVQGIPITGTGEDYERIRDRLAGLAAGDPVVLEVLRGGRVIELSGALQTEPDPAR